MTVVVIANPKGGVGKSTLATNVAGYLASRGCAVMLGDADRQGSSQLWLSLRPPAARPISSWDVRSDNLVKPPKGTTHVVLDTPGGLHGRRLGEVVKLADKIIVPLQPSVFDIFATRTFLDQLADYRRMGKGRWASLACGWTPAPSQLTSCRRLWPGWVFRCWAWCVTRKTTSTWRPAD